MSDLEKVDAAMELLLLRCEHLLERSDHLEEEFRQLVAKQAGYTDADGMRAVQLQGEMRELRGEARGLFDAVKTYTEATGRQ